MVSAFLRNKCNQLPKMRSLLVRVYVEDLADAVIVVPLLEELFLIRGGITLDEILQLWQVGGEEDTSTHLMSREGE